MSYREIDKIKKDARFDVFCMAVSYLLDKGYDYCVQITDEDIASIEGNGLMTTEFSQELVRIAREIARAENGNPIDIIQYCETESVFETEYYAGKIGRVRLGELLNNAISYFDAKNMSNEEIAENLDALEEEMEMLGRSLAE